MRIVVVGTGYVGLSNAVILAQHNQVTAVDINQAKVAQINARTSPIIDSELQDYLSNKPLELTATTDAAAAYEGAEFVVVATPTDYDPQHNYFDTSSVESVVAEVLAVNPGATIVVKSTGLRLRRSMSSTLLPSSAAAETTSAAVGTSGP